VADVGNDTICRAEHWIAGETKYWDHGQRDGERLAGLYQVGDDSQRSFLPKFIAIDYADIIETVLPDPGERVISDASFDSDAIVA